jgi:DNA helicase-2/ATP-dependent DNA helicase PcrA
MMASKALLLRQIGNSLPGAYRFRPAGDLATEVEWAKNRRLTPQTYLGALGEHEPPIPADLMARVFREYERRKRAQGLVDFEDLLELAVLLYDENEWALASFRERYRAFTVDEYQDVNLLQQTLLERWIGSSPELCAVGDDYQSIYSFTGATPEYLLALPRRFPDATVVRLEENYRSSPEVLELTNRLVPRLGGAPKQLRATLPSGPDPELRSFQGPDEEARFLAGRVQSLAAEGVPFEEMAVLFRTNARSADFETTLHAAGIPFQGASLLARDGARGLLKRLRGASGPGEELVRRTAGELGWLEAPPEGLGERERTRQDDLSRIVGLAAGLEDIAELPAELERLFGTGAARGVHLLTLHRAKGLEFDAVFLPRLEEGELPVRQARTESALAEERRLLYVGMTRARRHLALTWAGRPSRFLRELGVAAAPERRERRRLHDEDLPPAARALRAWRLERARSDAVPAYVVFDDRTLEEIVRRAPASRSELAAVPGIGPARLERYGADVLAVLAAA